MDSVIYDPRVEKLKKDFFKELEANRICTIKIQQALIIETAGKLMYKAVKRGKSTR